MKKLLSVSMFIFVLCFLYTACRKTQNQPVKPSNYSEEQTIINDAINYFRDSVAGRSNASDPLAGISAQAAGAFNPIKQLTKSPLWTKAHLLFLTIGPVVVTPLQFNDSLFARPSNTAGTTRLSLSNLCNLLVYTDMYKKKHAEVVLFLPDQDFIDGKNTTFSGVAFVTDWRGNYLRSYLYGKGQIWQLKISHSAETQKPGAKSVAPTETADPDCTETDWYSCTGTIDDPFQYCTYTETTYTGCSTGGGGSGGGGTGQIPSGLDYGLMNSGGSSGSSVSSQFQFVGPKYPVMIGEEMNCFTANSSSTYSISLNVEEPVPGSGNAALGLDVGHTYLTFEQDNSDGTKIIRNDGFYPIGIVTPFTPIDYSVFGENSLTQASAVLKIRVNSTDFMTAVGSEVSQQSHTYNLYTFNCATSALTVLESIGINNLDQYAAGTLFTGNFPGNLGLTIRNLDLDVFSQLNGNRQMVRTLSTANNIMPPAKTGSCPDLQ